MLGTKLSFKNMDLGPWCKFVKKKLNYFCHRALKIKIILFINWKHSINNVIYCYLVMSKSFENVLDIYCIIKIAWNVAILLKVCKYVYIILWIMYVLLFICED